MVQHIFQIWKQDEDFTKKKSEEINLNIYLISCLVERTYTFLLFLWTFFCSNWIHTKIFLQHFVKCIQDRILSCRLGSYCKLQTYDWIFKWFKYLKKNSKNLNILKNFQREFWNIPTYNLLHIFLHLWYMGGIPV